MRKKSFLLLGFGILVLFCLFGSGLAEAANADLIDGGVGLSSIDDTLKKLARGIVALARPIVAIMTAIAGTMAILNVGDSKRPMWYAILGIGLLLNLGDVLWSMWGKYANPATGLESAIEYSIQIKDTVNADSNGVDILSTFMRYYLEIIVTGAERIKPIAVKLLLILALIDASIRLALDLTEKDKMAWMVKTFLRIGFYVFLINSWLGVGGLNLMDSLSKGFQEIGYMAGNYGQALPTSIDKRDEIDPKDNLAPDSIINNGFKMFMYVYEGVSSPEEIQSRRDNKSDSSHGGGGGKTDDGTGGVLDKVGRGIKNIPGVGLVVSAGIGLYHMFDKFSFGCVAVLVAMVAFIICIFLTGIEMFMARIEFYTLALLGIPLLAFGAIKHFEYLAQQTIRAVFNCGVKLCVISFLQAVLCRLFTKFTNELYGASIFDNMGHILSVSLQLLLVSLIMVLLTLKIPKLIQGLLSGNPSLGGSDMTGTTMGVATTAVSTAAMFVGAGKAASQAKAAAEAGDKTVAPWRMSQMKQFGAALMRHAPITGAAYSAYSEVANFGKNDNQGNRDASRDTRPVTNPSAQKPGQKPATNPSPSSTPAGPGGGDAPQKAGGGYVEPSSASHNTENADVQGSEGIVATGNVSESHESESMPGALSSVPSPMPRSDGSITNPQVTSSAPSMQYRSMASAPRSGGSITNPQINPSASSSPQYRSPSITRLPGGSITNPNLPNPWKK